MQITPVKTSRVYPGDCLKSIFENALPTLMEDTIVCVTSKIISLCENAVVAIADVASKQLLIQQEADAYLPHDPDARYGVCLTIKNNILIPTAGIDESNGQDVYILYPRDVFAAAASLWSHLKEKHGLKRLGILITDSRSTPLRWGVTGVAIGWCGFEPLYDYRGTPDCFGRNLRMTQINLLDALAVPAVYVMGEGAEQTPLALITNAPKITFQDHPPRQTDIDGTKIALKDCLYAPLLRSAPWVWTK